MVRRNLTSAAMAALMVLSASACEAEPSVAPQAPEFTHTTPAEWINSKPLSLRELRGKVVLVEFWTFECVNCLRSADWVRKIASEKRDDGLVVIGVHTPEFAHERDLDNVRRAVERLGITYPVMVDNDFSYWKAMKNRYWPAFYAIDAQGRIQSQVVGELRLGEPRSRKFEQALGRLLAPEKTDE